MGGVLIQRSVLLVLLGTFSTQCHAVEENSQGLDMDIYQPLEDKVLDRLIEKDDGPFEKKIKKLLAEYLLATAVETVTNGTSEEQLENGRALLQNYYPPPPQQQPQVVYVYGTPPPSGPTQRTRRTKPPRTRRPSHHHHHHESSEERNTQPPQPVIQPVYIQQPPYNPQYPPQQQPPYNPQYPPQQQPPYNPQYPPQQQPPYNPQYPPQQQPPYNPQQQPPYNPQYQQPPPANPPPPPPPPPAAPQPTPSQQQRPLDAPQDNLGSGSDNVAQTSRPQNQTAAAPSPPSQVPMNATIPPQPQQPQLQQPPPYQPQQPPPYQPQQPYPPVQSYPPPQPYPPQQPPPIQVVYLPETTPAGQTTSTGPTTTPRPRPSQQHVYNQVNAILDNVGRGNITGIVDQALGIRTPMPTRNFVNGILNTVFCNPINRLLGRCRG